MANILVIGGAGQVGAPLVRHLQANSSNVVTSFDKEHSEDQNIRQYPHQLLERAIIEADFVYFLAFDVGGSKYLKEYEKTYQFINNNVMLMNTTFRYLEKYRKPFIFTSSQMSNMPYSVYGQLKAMGESYTRALGGVSVKFWNVYGIESESEQKAHVITDFVRMGLSSEKTILMRTTGTEYRQFLYVDDCVRGMELIRDQYDRVSRTDPICITSYSWSTINDVADEIASQTGAVVIQGEAHDTVQRDKMNAPHPYFQELWESSTNTEWPMTSLSDGIAEIIRCS